MTELHTSRPLIHPEVKDFSQKTRLSFNRGLLPYMIIIAAPCGSCFGCPYNPWSEKMGVGWLWTQ